jgi:glycosyltransferase involved in cell wall biosynthesis
MLHLVPRETGGLELYARRLVPALLEAGVELTVLASREGAPSLRLEPWAADVEITELPVNARSRPRRVLAEQTLLPLAAARARVDLLHNLFATSPALSPVPSVTTIHDLIYRHVPETHAGVLGRGLAALTLLSARRSRRILTVSEAAKADIVRFLGVPPDRVDVAYNGPGLPDDLEPVPERELRQRLSLGDAEIVLTVSAKRPHKNLERLIDAFALVRRRRPAALVVPGYATGFEADLRERARTVEGVTFAGWVDDETLDGLYRAAACFVFPSLAEGFGLPVLEAMIRGAPVACSAATSLPEVGGDAALYFDPTDVEAIAAAVERVLDDQDLRERLRERGYAQARRFDWARTARLTVACYERALR